MKGSGIGNTRQTLHYHKKMKIRIAVYRLQLESVVVPSLKGAVIYFQVPLARLFSLKWLSCCSVMYWFFALMASTNLVPIFSLLTLIVFITEVILTEKSLNQIHKDNENSLEEIDSVPQLM